MVIQWWFYEVIYGDSMVISMDLSADVNGDLMGYN